MVMEESISIWKLDGESTDIVLSIISDSRETKSSEVKKKLAIVQRRGEITFLIRIKCGIIEKNFSVHLWIS